MDWNKFLITGIFILLIALVNNTHVLTKEIKKLREKLEKDNR